MPNIANPWGRSQDTKVLVTGGHVINVTTAGHGGIGVKPAWAAEHLSAAARERGTPHGQHLWYEEDCDFAIVLWESQEARDRLMSNSQVYDSDEKRKQGLLETLSRWNVPYLVAVGVEPDPAGLAQWEERQHVAALGAAKSPDLVIAACGSWHEDCPEGAVLVTTADQKTHLIMAEDYAARNGTNLLSKYRPFEAPATV